MTKTYFNWSTGKDSALALHELLPDKDLSIDLLLTTVNAHHNRVSMHGLRRELLFRQAEAIGIPLRTVELPEQPSMEEYNNIMSTTLSQLKEAGYTACGFGDIFLEDLRAYREKQLEGINCHFPLWKKDTHQVMESFINSGFKAIVLTVNGNLLDESFVGRELDQSFLDDLPDNVDPCGENGEFHTFCYDGPIFQNPVQFEKGEKVQRFYDHPDPEKDEKIGYWFLDLIP